MTAEIRQKFMEQVCGKVICSVEYIEAGKYYVMHLGMDADNPDGEFCFRLMNEIPKDQW